MSENTTGIEWMDRIIDKALDATLGKYKANRNPAVAALCDPDPEIRAGAAYMLSVIYCDRGVLTPNTLPTLKGCIDREKDIKTRAMMRVAYARITEKQRTAGSGGSGI